MPRYFIKTSDGEPVHDEVGIDVPDVRSLEIELRKALATILRDEPDHNQFSAEATDDRGQHVLTVTVSTAKFRS